MTENNKETIVIKYGGNAMLNSELTEKILRIIYDMHSKKYRVVIVHGGGPFIGSILDTAGIKSEFIGGQRKTTPEAMRYIEMSLKGEVNSNIVSELNKIGAFAVGLSGKDGKLALAERRFHKNEVGENVDLGQVGNIKSINTNLLNTLLDNGYIPVVATIAAGEDGENYNINADIFAGHLAGALKCKKFIMLTDVDGLMEDPDNESSLLKELKTSDIKDLIGSVIKGGMIPKTEACQTALDEGASNAFIANGTKPEMLQKLILDNLDGIKYTRITN
jgi:acetylglutamate kinase